MIRLLVGALVSAAVLFAWGFVFWFVSGVMYQFMRPVADEDAAKQALQQLIPESGTYLIPFPDRAAVSGSDAGKAADLLNRYLQGPVVEINYRKEGVTPNDPQQFVAGGCQFLAASLVASVLLVLAQPGLQRYLARVLFVTLLGVFASVAVKFSDPIWFHHPWPTALYESGYVVVGWLLAGLAMGLVIKPSKEAKKAALARVVEVTPVAPPNP
jgi:hypothetical protein